LAGILYNSSRFSLTRRISKGILSVTSKESVILILPLSLLIVFTYKVSTCPSVPVFTVDSSSVSKSLNALFVDDTKLSNAY
jgi:hypothetical protein